MDKSPMQRIARNFYGPSSLREKEHNSLLLKCGLPTVTSVQGVQYGRRGVGEERVT